MLSTTPPTPPTTHATSTRGCMQMWTSKPVCLVVNMSPSDYVWLMGEQGGEAEWMEEEKEEEEEEEEEVVVVEEEEEGEEEEESMKTLPLRQKLHRIVQVHLLLLLTTTILKFLQTLVPLFTLRTLQTYELQ